MKLVLPGRVYVMGDTRSLSSLDLGGIHGRYGFTRGFYLAWKTPDLRWSRLFPYEHVRMHDSLVTVEHGPLDRVVEEATAEARAGGRVLLQCYGGRNRSMLAAGLVLRELLGYSGLWAYDHIMSVDPTALWNPAFAAYLRGLPAPGG